MQLLSILFALFTSWHTRLYHPEFPKLPILSREESPTSLVLSVPNTAYANPPQLLAKSFVLIDQQSGETLAEKDADTRLFPASTTKIMTALVVLRHMNLESVASVSANIQPDGSQMHLVAGEQIKIRDLLAGLLIQSANDAAVVLAAQYPGGEEAFISQMNSTATELSLRNTFYTNPIGYSEPGHVTTVRDLVILAKEAMLYPEFAQFVKEEQRTVHSIDNVHSHTLRTTNELLGKFPGIEGIKTGWTQESGECLVTQTTREGRTLLSAVLDSPSRFVETTVLMEWGYSNFRNEEKTLGQW